MLSIAILSIPLLVLLAVEASERDLYKDIYPPLFSLSSLNCSSSSHKEPHPLFITTLLSFGGSYVSSGALPATQIALDEINRDSTMLPGYTLHYTLKDSNVSSVIKSNSKVKLV